ncbi:laccase domain protein [Iodidimonas nitroreducens]|uniref:Laccase domain protein n=2 Tax=Iodidimonas nitroreducens TaxID=1236968 RepID=A0A5A7N5C1_9PROT|nr:laccase domain protein [alpha proteobacterium Q-1]GER03167.1 laccase domain protein [Iodidimonas nitroreducens]
MTPNEPTSSARGPSLQSDAPHPIPSALLGQMPGVVHGFFSRSGGVSTGLYSSLNAGRGSSDKAAAVAENRRRIEGAMGGLTLVTPYQIHSNLARPIWGIKVASKDRGAEGDALYDADDPPRCDALISDQPGLLLGIVTADCAPVLLADPKAGVLAACHAGWRGAASGVIDATIEMMIAYGARPDRMSAAIGPMIAQASYEVGAEVRQAFLDQDPAFAAFFVEGGRPEAFQCDLEGIVAALLARAGVRAVDPLGLDTYRLADRFYSYRRATHLDEPDYGRQLSVIGLKP